MNVQKWGAEGAGGSRVYCVGAQPVGEGARFQIGIYSKNHFDPAIQNGKTLAPFDLSDLATRVAMGRCK